MEPNASTNPAGDDFDLRHLCRFFCEHSTQRMIAVEGADCIVRHVNDAFLNAAGLERARLLGRPFAEVVTAPDANGCLALLARVFHSGVAETLAEQQISDDPAVYWSYAAWPICRNHQLPIGVMLQVTDVTEMALFRRQSAAMNESLILAAIKQLELSDHLEEALKAKSHLIAVLSHELRTPLTPIIVVASMLEKDARLDGDTRAAMALIHRNAVLEARLVDDLLDTTRMEHGNVTLDKTNFDLRGVIERAAELSKVDLSAAGLSLVIENAAGPLMVEGDERRLEQVFSNLVRNAVKFTPKGGRIKISSFRFQGLCKIVVEDTGIGIDPEFIPRAFTAFEQGDKTHARTAGLGLGLSICKTIVDLHSGTIDLRSAGRGRGTTVIVTLTLRTDAPSFPARRGPPDADRSGPVRPLRILVVEDDVSTAKAMTWVLRADGHAVEVAGSVAGGLAMAKSHVFDLLLSDFGLPDGTGADLMRTLRQHGSNLPGIVLSGYGQQNDIATSRAAGFAAHLVKPWEVETLKAAIASYARPQ